MTLREYETIFVLDGALEGETLENEVNKVVKIIEGGSGKVHDLQRWGRRRLAYPLKKKTDGNYTYVRYDGTNEILAELDRRLDLNESALRHMTILVDPAQAKANEGAGQFGASEDRDRDRDRGDRDRGDRDRGDRDRGDRDRGDRDRGDRDRGDRDRGDRDRGDRDRGDRDRGDRERERSAAAPPRSEATATVEADDEEGAE